MAPGTVKHPWEIPNATSSGSTWLRWYFLGMLLQIKSYFFFFILASVMPWWDGSLLHNLGCFYEGNHTILVANRWKSHVNQCWEIPLLTVLAWGSKNCHVRLAWLILGSGKEDFNTAGRWVRMLKFWMHPSADISGGVSAQQLHQTWRAVSSHRF